MNKKNLFRRLSCFLLAVIFIVTTDLPVFAAEFPSDWPKAPEISNASGILMEASTGQILFDKDMDEIRYPASTTKILTALLILENIPDLNKKITFTDVILPDLEPGNSTINAQVGEELTVEQCLYAILLPSANEVCTQMAVSVAGSVSGFTAMMNQRAAELGCKNTHFTNANGLPDPNHYTTAHDLALILAEAVKNEAFCKIAGAASYTIPPTNMTPSPRELTNHNELLTDGSFHYEGAIAGKTGHTEAARNTLVTAAKRDDLTLVCVVMRSEGNERFVDTASLFDYGFDNFHKASLYWLSQNVPAGMIILPNDISENSLLIQDSDADNVRTRTYSYQGSELFRASASLPIETETRYTADVTAFKTGVQKKRFISPLLLPAMIIIFVILSAALVSVILKEVRYRKTKPGKKKRKTTSSKKPKKQQK